jgi:rhodanese-related sulfurtransferase
MKTKKSTAIFCLAGWTMGIVGLPGMAQSGLAFVEKQVSGKFHVDQMSIAEFKALESNTKGQYWLVLDVRQEEEYSVSHLNGAVQVNPAMTADTFAAVFGDRLKGKHVLFYCSVGYRSSEFADRVAQVARAQGVASMQNLTGGIFRWFNEAHPVFRDGQEVHEVHPYDAIWGRFLKKRLGEGVRE